MADCIFCKIAAGEIPCTKVYEDDLCLVFMDIGPISPGHTLLIPKRHYETIMEMPPDEVAHLAARIPALAAAVKDAARAEGINVLQNNGRCSGQAVPTCTSISSRAGRRTGSASAGPPKRPPPRRSKNRPRRFAGTSPNSL